ncbi:MAG: ATP-dependent sacrificial sulfur transferase LarE [Pseudanabaenaceae cyanobacterium SKYGB_i_bin29]|nr:ATP-dependent sacrificial sulfur transferase LarE [Pseudanabaenaceae cyanobacterium SKYGB_i_bin29]
MEKYYQLREFLGQYDRVLIAYSGGVDSTLVAQVAYGVLGERAVAVTANSPSLFPAELEAAKQQAQAIGIPHLIIETREIEDPRYSSNPPDRCYFCKSALYDKLLPLAAQLNCEVICDGVNADDLRDYRPGIRAAKERSVVSPLAHLGISKLEVRAISRWLGLPWWDKPAQPCLSSRFPYGEAITPQKLERVGKAEYILRQFLPEARELRVRSIGDSARIEISKDLFPLLLARDVTALTAALRQLGFTNISLDLEGFRSGKLNDVLVRRAQEPPPKVTMELSVPSIVCEGCVDTITKAIKNLDPQAEVTADLERKTIAVQTTASLDDLRTAITNTGHTVQ